MDDQILKSLVNIISNGGVTELEKLSEYLSTKTEIKVNSEETFNVESEIEDEKVEDNKISENIMIKLNIKIK